MRLFSSLRKRLNWQRWNWTLEILELRCQQADRSPLWDRSYFRPRAELLEERLCPANYDYNVIAQTVTPITSITQFPSINDFGQVAFVGSLATGGNAVFVGTGNGTTPTNISGPGNQNATYLATAQINNAGYVLATQNNSSPPNFDSSLDLWKASNPPGTAPQQMARSDVSGTLISTYATLANDANPANGNGIAFGAITSPEAPATLQMPNPPLGFGTLLSGYTGDGSGLQPMMADNNQVVFQGGNGPTFPILLNKGPGTNITIASSPDFSALGAAPGISPDGQVIAFYGYLTETGVNAINSKQNGFTQLIAGPGIFASVKTSHGRVILRVAGTGGNAQGLPDVATFDANNRVAVNTIHEIGVGSAFTVAFMGQSPGPIISDGIYVNLVDVLGNSTDPTGFRANVDTLVAEVGDTITGVSGGIQALSMDDAINSFGQVAFWVSTTVGSSAVVVANTVPVMAVAPLSQGNPDWAGPYAGGPSPQYTMQNNACALYDLTMAINYSGAPSLRYLGSDHFTPRNLDALLLAAGGYSGHSIDWTRGPSAAIQNGGATNLIFNDLYLKLSGQSDSQTLTQLLNSFEEPVIVGVHLQLNRMGQYVPSHFVLVTGMVGNQFTIDDPGDATNHYFTATSNSFQIRGFFNDPTDMSALGFSVVGASPVDLLVTNGSQQQTGTDPTTGTIFNSIPQSVTFSDALEDSVGSNSSSETATFVIITQPGKGTYTVTVGGGTIEPFTVYASPKAPDGALLPPQIMSGTVTPGTSSTLQYSYDAGFQLPRVSISDVTQAEPLAGSTSSFNFTVSLSSQPSQPVTLDYATTDNTATTAGNDYQAVNGTLTFTPDGSLTQTISVPVNGENSYGPDKTFGVILTDVANAAMTKTVGAGTIQNDNTPISINSVSQYEGIGGTTPFVFTVSLAGPSSLPITVNYATADGTAREADGDYQGQAGTLTFNPGEISKTITINVPGDEVPEGNESFFVDLASPVNGQLMANAKQGTGTIQGDSGGTNYYVNDASQVGDVFCTAPGNIANDGKSPATPAASLSALLSEYTFHRGDTVYVDTGAYTLAANVVLGPQYSGLTIIGAGERQPTPSLNANVILADNPVAYWRLNDSGGSTAVDATGHGYAGTYMNGVVQGAPGPSTDGASLFEEQSQITVPDAPGLDLGQYSIEAWVNFHGSQQDGIIVDKAASDWSNGYHLAVEFNGTFPNGAVTFDDVTAPLPQSQWVYLVATYDGNTSKIYVNGQMEGSLDVGLVPPSNLPLLIGNGTVPGHFPSPWHGFLDDIAIYDHALSASQILAHFQSVAWSGTVLDRANTSYLDYAIELSGASGVTISNLSITNAGIGIYASGTAASVALTVSNVSLYENGQGIDLEASNDNVTITGSSIGSTIGYAYADGIVVFGANSKLINNAVFGSIENGIEAGGPNTTISGNVVYDNSRNGIADYNAYDGLITGNVAYGNNFQNGSAEGAIYVTCDALGDYGVVSNNVAYGNNETGINVEVGLNDPNGTLLVQNNVTYSNLDGIECAGPVTIESNAVYGNEIGINQIPSYDSGYFGSSGLISDNNVYDNQKTGIIANFGTVVQNNRVSFNSIGIAGEVITLTFGPNGSSTVPFNGTIKNNVLYGNYTAGVLIAGATSANVLGNTVFQQIGDAVEINSKSANVALLNNIIWTDGGYDINVANDSQQGFTSDYNLLYTTGVGKLGFWGSDYYNVEDWTHGTGQDAHSLEVNPRFVDLAGNDFHLQSGSPAVAAGDPASDYSRQPAPSGGRINLGAYGNTSEATTTAASAVLIEQVGGSTVAVEGGDNGSYFIVLTSKPASDVTVSIMSTNEVAVFPSVVTFTSSNWNIAQHVTVTALADEFAEGSHTVTIDHSASSLDPAYSGIAIPSVSVLVQQPFNHAGISLSRSTISAMALTIPENGSTAVTLKVRNDFGNQETGGGLTVAFELGAGSAGGSFGTVIDNQDGTYTATFSGTSPGADTIIASIDGRTVDSSAIITVVNPPAITRLSPTHGAIGSSVVITGTDLAGATAVSFNNTLALTFTVDSSTQITVKVPAGASSGVIDVSTPGGTAASPSNFTVDAGNNSSPTSTISALPAISPQAFVVAWTGSPGSGGSPIASYAIFVSDNGSAFTVWLSGTGLTSASFSGSAGHSYGFYSIANDQAGGVQPTPASAQATTTVDATPPTSSVLSLPPSEASNAFTISWSGSDGIAGSGIASYAIYVSDNGSAFTPFLVNTSQTSATFTGTVGHVYGFYSVATDKVGNVQVTPGSAQATTTVVAAASGAIGGIVFRDFNLNGQKDAGEPALAGLSVFLDLNNNGILDPNEQTRTTNVGGAYSFTGLAAGTYTVRQVLLGGTILDAPSKGSYSLTVASGSTFSNENFAEVFTSITVPLTLPPGSAFPAQGTANADYVEAIYRAVLDRNADTGGLSSWTGNLNNGSLTRLQVVQGIRNSPEHFGQEIDVFYHTLLARSADATGRGFWVQQLENGIREEQIAFDFLNSPEYLSKGDKYFVDAMYQSLLGRSFDPTGEASWLKALGDDSLGNPNHAATLTHAQVINDFLFSSESLDRLVEGYYEVFLQRQADPGGLNFWVAELQHGLPFLTIGQEFIASDEFYNKAAANH